MDAGNAITIAIPTIAVMFGILLNRQDATAIRGELKAEIGQVRNEIGQLRTEMVTLRNSIHGDMVGIHERLAVVESKQES